jgi:hypothetical protein
LWVAHGVITVGDQRFDNMVPTALCVEGDVKLVFSGAEGVLEVVGGGLRVEVTGEAVFADELSGTCRLLVDSPA